MGKKVKVVTKCGETFTYDYNQEVETVEIVEEPKRRTNIGFHLYLYGGHYFEKAAGYDNIISFMSPEGKEIGFINRRHFSKEKPVSK